MNAGAKCSNWEVASARMTARGIHASETAWLGTKFDHILDNNGSIDDLYRQVKNLV
jgi:hypothetical protein